MSVQSLIDAALKLSPAEQGELFDALRRIVEPEDPETMLTPAQRADLERRLEEFESGNARMSPGPAVFARLRERRR